MRPLWCCIILLALAWANFVQAQIPHPAVTHTVPAAIERGKTTQVIVYCQPGSLAGTFFAHFDGAGVRAEAVPSDKPGEVTLNVTVEPGAALGLREFRLATPTGITTVGQLLIAAYPVIAEQAEPHAVREQAQAIGVNQVLSGMLNAKEQVDMYKFQAAAGQELTLSMCAHRFFYKRHSQFDNLDPILSVYDAAGRELASNDDYNYADSLIHMRFDQAGEYFVAVRDIDFNGTPKVTYALTVTDQPYATAVQPLVFAPNGPRTATASGFKLASGPAEVQLPAGAPVGRYSVQLTSGGVLTSPVMVEVSDMPLVSETEPNNERTQAQPLTLPIGINGQISEPGDMDSFSIALKSGQSIRCEVRARQLNSSLDSLLRLLNADGGLLATNDDAPRSKDSLLTYKATADGVVTLQIRDLLNRGGETFNYFLAVSLDEPDFEITSDDDKAGMCPRGAAPRFLRAVRRGGFEGPIEVSVAGLPTGVTVNPLTIPAGVADAVLVFQAAADAPQIASAVRLTAKAQVTGTDGQVRQIERRVIPLMELDMPGGSRNVWPVETEIVAVHPNVDIMAVKVSQPSVTLEPGKQVTIDVEIVRHEKYKGRITLDLRLQHLGQMYGNPLPTGVKLDEGASKLSLGESENQGKIVISSAADAKAVGPFPITVLANVSISFVVKRAYCSPPIVVTMVGK